MSRRRNAYKYWVTLRINFVTYNPIEYNKNNVTISIIDLIQYSKNDSFYLKFIRKEDWYQTMPLCCVHRLILHCINQTFDDLMKTLSISTKRFRKIYCRKSKKNLHIQQIDKNQFAAKNIRYKDALNCESSEYFLQAN